jgi:hypothetical protein
MCPSSSGTTPRDGLSAALPIASFVRPVLRMSWPVLHVPVGDTT